MSSNIVNTASQELDKFKAECNVDIDQLVSVLDRFEEIPFNNSDFQIQNFIINAALTPERAYRTIGVNFASRLTDLISSLANLEELYDHRERFDHTELPFRRLEKELNIRRLKKSIRDNIIELNQYSAALQQLPAYNKEQFELAEKNYFLLKLAREEAKLLGAAESIENVMADGSNIQKLLANETTVTHLIGDIIPELAAVLEKQDELKLVK